MLKHDGLRLVLTFDTTADAIATERLCKTQNLAGRLIPVPRELTSDCGMAWSAPIDSRTALETALAAAKIYPAAWNELDL